METNIESKEDQDKIENEETTIIPETSQKDPNPLIVNNSPEEHENKEQAIDEAKNIEEEPIKTEDNDEIEKEISNELEKNLNVQKPKEKSHFINL